MTKLNPTELAEQHKKDQIKARNREYQKLYYKLHKKEILKKKKKKREEARSDSDEAESRAAKRYEKRRQYQREYYLKHKKLKLKPSKEKQREIDAQCAIDRANYQHKWYQKNR